MMAHASAGTGERLTVDLNDVASEYVRIAKGTCTSRHPDHDVTIVEDYNDQAGSVRLNPKECGKAVVNILLNAFDAVRVRAASEGGGFDPTINVSTHHSENHVKVRIQDNGPGIPDDVRDRIFEPFFTTKPAGSGTGLGLSLAHDIIVQGHGGCYPLKVNREKDRRLLSPCQTDSDFRLPTLAHDVSGGRRRFIFLAIGHGCRDTESAVSLIGYDSSMLARRSMNAWF